MTTQTTDFWKLYKAKNCNLSLTAVDKDSVLAEIVAHLVKSKLIEPDIEDAVLRVLVERERLASTGVGINVAIPHVEIEGIDEVVVSISRHAEGVEWQALDGEDAKLFFTVLRPTRPSASYDPERHLEMMRWISRLSRDADFRRFAMAAKNRTEIVDLLKEMAGV